MAMSGGDTYVVHAPASALARLRDGLLAGMAFRGPALFCVYSGAGARLGGLPPYLAAAAALEARAFPVFTFDPSAGSDWASRLSLDGNPQVERDWPAAPLACEDARHQRRTETIAFTFADFVALDERGGRHLARVPRAGLDTPFARVEAASLAGPVETAGAVPALWMVDAALTVQQVIVDERLLREVRRCRDQWHSLQALGVHNSHAERLMARDPSPAAPAVDASAIAAPAVDAPAERVPGDPYIDTARCSTCNECTRINPRMFAYNDNRQAYIKDPDAGTFADLVEAAESCQVSIIHPGTPRNPNEPGLDALIRRAEAFQ
jgi:ferredoxin